MRSLYADKHNRYWRNEISVDKGNTQGLWWTLHGILGDSVCNDDSPFRADDFAKYFKDKVDSVGGSTAATPLCDVPRRVTLSLADFTAVTVDEVAKLISSAPNKTCQLDPAPTWLVKDMIGLLSPFIVLLVMAQRHGSLGRRTALPQSKCRPRCAGDDRHSAITKSAESTFTSLFTIN